jgi:Nif-specific regulatory protein
LQEGEFERVGGTRTIKVDVRLVTATNRNLEAAVISGDFRSDLYYRISVVPIFLPALRERKEDIALLAREFLKRFNKEHGVALSLSAGAMEKLSAYDFPGNVRELESCIRRTAALTKNPVLQAEDFELSGESGVSARSRRSTLAAVGKNGTALGIAEADDEGNFSGRERLVDAMERAGWVQAKAARLLGLTTRQMNYALRKHEIEIKRF